MRWKSYFFFTHSERRGIKVLLCIITFLVLVRLFLYHYAQAHPQMQPVQEQIAYGDSLFYQDSLQASQSLASQHPKMAPRKHRLRIPKTNDPVEINGADTTLLKQLRGIGSGYARMIVNYRKRLGGFYCKEQLLEVYHFPRETFDKIAHQLRVDTSLIQPLRINELSIEELKRHPYIRYFQAKSLVENRERKPDKKYHSMEDIVLDQDVTEEFLQKVGPYFSFD